MSKSGTPTVGASPLVTYSEAARRLGVGRRTVADLALAYGFGNRPHPHGHAKGLTLGEVEAIKRVLESRQTA